VGRFHISSDQHTIDNPSYQDSPIFTYIQPNNPLHEEFELHASGNNQFLDIFNVSVVFDSSLGQLGSIWDTGIVGLSDLAILLMNNSFSVSESRKFLNETISFMKNGDILVLSIGNFTPYTDQEVDLIVDFVEDGGNIFVIGEHDNYRNTAVDQNKLLTHFNMTINDDHVVDPIHYKPDGFDTSWIIFNSSFFNLIITVTLFFSSNIS